MWINLIKMSTSYNSGVILGVKITDIGFSIEEILNEYEVHDKKGKPTGKFETEKLFKLTFKDLVSVVPNVHYDIFDEMLDDTISTSSPLTILNINGEYYNFSIENVIIGINIINRGYNKYNLVEEIQLDDKIEIFKNEILSQFGVDIEPKLFYYFQIS